MKLIVDRFEENFAICETEDKEMINIDIEKLPDGVIEGDILLLEDGVLYIDNKSRSEREDYIKELMDDLWQ